MAEPNLTEEPAGVPEPDPADIELAWQRDAELTSGAVVGLSHEEVMRRARLVTNERPRALSEELAQQKAVVHEELERRFDERTPGR